MIGVIRAELLRLGKRGSLLLIVAAMPLLAVVFFGLGYASAYDPPPFNPVAFRQQIIDEGWVTGVPPDEVEQYIDEYVANEALNYAMQVESAKEHRTRYAFPQSLVTILGNATYLLLAIALLTAMTIGDEFGWGTIRTTLLGSSHRRRVLLVRIAALWLAAALMLGLLFLVGAIAPLFLDVGSRALLSPFPGIDAGALTVYVIGMLLAAFAIIAFATLSTLIVRHGALTLVSILVYVVVEVAILAFLTRFPEFGFDPNTGAPGELTWTLDALPAHGLATLMDAGARAASGMLRYEGDVVPLISTVGLPMAAFVAWGAAFAILAFWRFRRMDIVE